MDHECPDSPYFSAAKIVLYTDIERRVGGLFVALQQDAKVLQFDKSVRSKGKKGREKKFEIVMHL